MIFRLRGIGFDGAAAGAFDEDFGADGLAVDLGGGEGVSSSTMGRFCDGQYVELRSIGRESKRQVEDTGTGGRRTDGWKQGAGKRKGGGRGGIDRVSVKEDAHKEA